MRRCDNQISLWLLCALFFIELASCSIQFILPEPLSTLRGGSRIPIEWRYADNSSVPVSGSKYSVYLCAGGNDESNYERLSLLMKDDKFANPVSIFAHVDASVGGEHPNAYFLELLTISPDDKTCTYSHRFSLTNMIGSFSPAVQKGLQLVLRHDGPPRWRDIRERAAPDVALDGLNTVPFEDQTGPTKYAPVPKPPPTKISLQSAKPLFPTSSYKTAKSYLPTPIVLTTISAPAAQTAEFMENTAAPASSPDDDMQRFLNRWKD